MNPGLLTEFTNGGFIGRWAQEGVVNVGIHI
jgi:hypothetical protein